MRSTSACSPNAAAFGYARRRPEATVLYDVVAEYWPCFRERADEVGGLPKFVTDEFDALLSCGLLEHGCLRLACRRCGHERLVAFSCKKRGFCPSCLGRRMADTAVHLEQRVFPQVPIRHWICTFPWGLRVLLGYDRALARDVTRAVMTELSRSLRRRAKRLLGLSRMADAHTGAVSAIQRADSALRLNVHLHTLALDGVSVRKDDAGPLVFCPLPAPTESEVPDLARLTALRMERILTKHGRSLDPELSHEEPSTFADDEPALASCYAAAARAARTGQQTLRLVGADEPPKAAADDDDDDPIPCAEVSGITIHAKEVVDGRDRKRLERLCRYIIRPPVAKEHLSRLPDGRVRLELKNTWRDGTRAFVLDPDDLLARLCAAVPPPGFHMLRYFGVLSSHSSLRSEVVPDPPLPDDSTRPPPASGDQLDLYAAANDGAEPEPRRKRWGWLLKHVFREDVDTCDRCGGAMRWLEVATTAAAIRRAMADHGLAPKPPSPSPARAPPEQLGFRW